MFVNKLIVCLVIITSMLLSFLCNHVKISLNSLNKMIIIIFNLSSIFALILTFFDISINSKLTSWTCLLMLYDHLIMNVSCNTRCTKTLFSTIVPKILFEKCGKITRCSLNWINNIAKWIFANKTRFLFYVMDILLGPFLIPSSIVLLSNILCFLFYYEYCNYLLELLCIHVI